MEGIEAVIEQLEKQKTAIDRALEALQAVGITKRSAPPTPAGHATGNARSIAQKARWAKVKESNQGSGLTAEGRARLAENMRKRWAAKRTAAQAKKRGRKAA
jgi:hypothetical protein